MQGYFWLPQDRDEPTLQQLPDSRVAGTLVADEEGPWQLKLLGSLLPSDHLMRHGHKAAFPRKDIIHGFSSNNSALTLFDTWRSSFSMFSALLDQETWNIGWYSAGDAWLEETDAISSLRLEFDVLSEWAGFGTRSRLDYDQEAGTLHVPSPETIQVNIDHAEIRIRSGWNQVFSIYNFDARPNACIEIKDDLSLGDVKKWVSSFRLLLSFLTIGYVAIDRIVARPSGTDADVSLHFNTFKLVENSTRRVQDLGSHILASPNHFTSVGLDLQDFFSNFFEIISDDDHEAAIWLLNESSERSLDKTVENALLNAFRALERYHSAAIGGTSIDPDRHKERVDRVVENAPEELQSWVRERLVGANEKGLKRRLYEVLERATGTAIAICEAWPRFFASIISLRSRVAHGHPQSGGETGLRYHAAGTGLRWILRHVYLRELGLSDHDAEDLVSRNPKFQDDLRLLRGWHQQLEGQGAP